LKIVFLAVRDTGGTAYTLAHAINKVTPEHQAVNIVGQNTFIQYPMIVDMADYSRKSLREMVYGSDVVVFLGAMQPFYESLHLQRKMMVDKKKILLCMGSEWRLGRDQLIEQADKVLGEYKIVLGGSDMFLALDIPDASGKLFKHFDAADEDEVAYLPVVRSFEEIQTKFGVNSADRLALESFSVPRRKVIFTHAPTSETNKGSHIFYRACTRAQQVCRELVFTSIRQQAWVTTLGILSRSDVLYDQAPPFPTAYGALSVEAGIFGLPSFSQVSPECHDFIKKHTGLDTPYITFSDDEDLFKKTVALTQDADLRRHYGKLNYDYCRQLHDEKALAMMESFMDVRELLESTDKAVENIQDSIRELSDLKEQFSILQEKQQELIDNFNFWVNEERKAREVHRQRVQRTCDLIERELEG
jgi:hypothetical protein